jgi:hypothetical protein
LITDSDSDSPKTASGEVNGLVPVVFGLPLALSVPDATVDDVAKSPLQHRSLVLVMFVNGAVGAVNADV